MIGSILLAVTVSVPALVSEDVLEPSVLNEVEHALNRVPNPDAPFGLGSVELLRLHATNGCRVTDNAIALVSAQRADGRWLAANGEDITAGAQHLLCAYADLPPQFAKCGGRSAQLCALKNNWAAEAVHDAQLPRDRAAWETWTRDGEKDGFAALVEKAKPMHPTLVTARRDPPNARSDWAVIAIGGSGQNLATIWKAQGEGFAARGLTVLMVENPPDDIARICLERGTSWLAYGTAALLPHIEELRREFPNLIWSGFSLGTELMMSTARFAAAPNDVFIYNDFLCRNKERLIVRDQEPNGLRYITPGYFVARDFPERMLALSDHKMIFTEGGLDRDFAIVRSVFPENVTTYQQPKFADGWRYRGANLPRHLTHEAFFALCNVDPRNHNYKWNLIGPWLENIIGENWRRGGDSNPR